MKKTTILILILLVILGFLFVSSLNLSKPTNIEKKKVKIVTPSYWITPEGPSWKPPVHPHY